MDGILAGTSKERRRMSGTVHVILTRPAGAFDTDFRVVVLFLCVANIVDGKRVDTVIYNHPLGSDSSPASSSSVASSPTDFEVA